MFLILFFISLVAGQLIKLPLGSGGITLLDIFVIFYFIVALIKNKLRFKNLPIVIKISFLFIGAGLVSLIFSPLKLTPFEYFVSFSYLARLLLYILFGWLIYSQNQLRNQLNKTLIFSGFTLAVLGLIQFIFLPDLGFLSLEGWDPHYFRVVSTFLDPNFAGAFFVLTLLLVFQYRLVKSSKYHLEKLMFFVSFMALVGTFSRSSYLMFGVSFFMLAFFRKSQRVFIITLLLTGILIASYQLYLNFVATPRNIDRNQSADYRINSWSQGWQIFSRQPLLGIGFNSYRYALRDYNLSNTQAIDSHGSSTNDASLLYVAATTGIVGLIIYLSLITSLLLYGYQLHLGKYLKGAVTIAAIGGLLVHSLFANSLFYPAILLWVILFLNSPEDFKN